MKTKTGYIGYLEQGSKIECLASNGETIKVVIKNISVDPDGLSVLLLIDHYIGNVLHANMNGLMKCNGSR
jgi:hypothetical protein